VSIFVCQNKAKIMCDCAKKFPCVDKEQFKIKLLLTIYHVKWTFKQKQIANKMKNLNAFSE